MEIPVEELAEAAQAEGGMFLTVALIIVFGFAILMKMWATWTRAGR